MLKHHVLEFHLAHARYRQRLDRPRFLRRIQNLLEVLEGCFRLAVDVDDVPDFLERPENKERVDKERKKLPDRDFPRKYEVKHEEQHGRAKGVYTSTLDEAE